MAGSNSVPPAVRDNADLIIAVAQPPSQDEREKLARWYLTRDNARDARKKGLDVMDKVTAVPFRAMVINKSKLAARRYRDYLFQYGPVPDPETNVPPKNFVVGKPYKLEGQDEENGNSGQINAKAVDKIFKSNARTIKRDMQRSDTVNGSIAGPIVRNAARKRKKFTVPSPFDDVQSADAVSNLLKHQLGDGEVFKRRRRK